MVVRVPDPSLVVLCGPAGSGKTTFARRHFRDTAIVSSDRCRAMIADDEANIRVSREAKAKKEAERYAREEEEISKTANELEKKVTEGNEHSSESMEHHHRFA